MKNKEEKTFFVKNLDIFIPVFVLIFFILISVFKLNQRLDSSLYDAMLRASPDVKESDSILLIDIEDKSIDEYGTWPWTRDIIADVIIRLKELSAFNVVFDIEYMNASSKHPASNIDDIVQNALSYDPQTAYSMITAGLNRDLDDYFARAVQFFGNTFLTVNMRDTGVEVSKEDEDYVHQRFLFGNVTDTNNLIQKGNEYTVQEEGSVVGMGFVPAIHQIINHAQGAGFTNAVVDKDGARRRVELLNRHGEKYTGQLAFSPLMKMLDVESIKRERQSILLKNALLPDSEEREDIRIPLDNHGRMYVNWLHKSYIDSFKHVPVFNFKYLDDDENLIYQGLQELSYADLSALSEDDKEFVKMGDFLIESYDEILKAKEYLLDRCNGFDIEGKAIGGGISPDEYDAYYEMRDEYFSSVLSFVNSLEGSAAIKESGIIPDYLSESINSYTENLALMKEYVGGTFCIIGNSATGSTDLGVTPFERRYANLGTHANVVNTILQKDFIRYVSVEWGILFAFVCAMVLIFVTRKKSSAVRSILGLIYVAVPTIIFILLMVAFRIYLPLAVPCGIVVVTYLSELALGFIATEKDKNTLRRGFDAYVAPEVVSEIVKNPNLLRLGGVSKHITALFSDIRKFSAITECINVEEAAKGKSGAVRLVDILNDYLGVLSDAIMAERGTIDKYVGDEIVSFFGAPIDNPNNAFDACVAGIRMKQAEDRYNEEHCDELPIHPETKTPFLLKSRVGLNTGEMVVGNMGTSKKLNYTIMGNAVNLASRLEGTNKEYDSWIMVSDSTWNDANSGANEGRLIARRLDCVRVINVKNPVQIYSIIGLRNELSPEEVEASEIFNKGMEWYLRGREEGAEPKDIEDFKKAIRLFEQAYACWHTTDPQDSSYISMEKKMIQRCNQFLTNGIPAKWDGVFTMKSK